MSDLGQRSVLFTEQGKKVNGLPLFTVKVKYIFVY
jgi:hypothetical protein